MRCSNLPSQLSTFIGREREIATVNRLLHQTRLLTLTGPGGCGKTRLALAVAEGLVKRYPDGAWLVELAPVSDPELAPQAVATVLQLREGPGRPLLDTLKAYLRTRRLLLVLDNCEHLVGACAELAHALLAVCPGLRILATSREPLHVTGETVWTVPPLAVPELTALPAVEELARFEAVRLFVERAALITPGFTINRQNAVAIGRICSLLAGSPLAIELAAARTRVLAPEQIAVRLADALGFLATADRTVPARHRTLQATLDWSYSLLSEGEQVLFRRLSVFPDSFSLEAAEAVCQNDGCGGKGASAVAGIGDREASAMAPALELLTALVDKSLLEVETEAGPERRFRYLEPVRQYALGKLEQAGDGAQARDRLLTWAIALAERLGPRTYSSDAKASVEQLEVEHPNLRAALEWGLTQPERAVERLRLAIKLAQFWQLRGYIGEGVSWFDRLLAGQEDIPIPLQIDTLLNAAFLSMHAHDFARARRDLERGIRLANDLEGHFGRAWLYHHLSFLTLNEGDLSEASRLCDASLGVFEQSGDQWGRAAVLFLRANVHFLQQDYAGARKDVEESIAICRDTDVAPALARRLVRLAQICLIEGDQQGAEHCLADGLRISRETGDRWGTAMALGGMAALAHDRGQHERAAWLLGVTKHFRDAFSAPLWPVDEAEYNRNQSELRLVLGEPVLQKAMEGGAKKAAGDLDATLRAVLDESEPGGAAQHPSAYGTAVALPAPTAFSPLTRREREVAALVAQGKSNAEIAATLFVGLRTVEAHVTHILNKLGFNSRAQIAAWISREPSTSASDLFNPPHTAR